MEQNERLKVFIDADVLIAAAASPSPKSASNIILSLGDLTIIRCMISEKVQREAVRNVSRKVPQAETTLREIIKSSVELVDDPPLEALIEYSGQANLKDIPVLVAAIENGCEYLLTFNTRHYYPRVGQIYIMRPGELVEQIRATLAAMS